MINNKFELHMFSVHIIADRNFVSINKYLII